MSGNELKKMLKTRTGRVIVAVAGLATVAVLSGQMSWREAVGFYGGGLVAWFLRASNLRIEDLLTRDK